MFWGLVLEPGKRYTTTVEKSFHVSMAALDCTTVKQDQEIMSVMLETEGQESLLCNLCKQKGVLQEKLDLNFLTGDTVTFTCRGSGTVHLSGYLVVDDDDELGEMMGEEEEDEEADEEDSGVDSSVSNKKKEIAQKRKNAPVSPQQTKKKKVVAEEESDEEEDDESSEGEEDAAAEEEGESEEEGDSEEMSSDEEDDDEDEEEDANATSKLVSPQENKKKAKQGGQLQQQQNQKIKSQQNTPNKQQQTPGGKGNKTPMANGFTPQQQQQSGKKDKKKGGGQDTPGQSGQNKTPNQQKTPGGQKTPGQQANVNTPKDKSPGGEGTPQKRSLEGGVVVKDLKAGNGPVAKGGRMITVYYTGKLKANNKVFDSATDGAGFKFRLGRGEVIKGWDVGIGGMRVGGKRVIICPAQMAYGQKGSPPHIPPNSSLVFEVELKAVN